MASRLKSAATFKLPGRLSRLLVGAILLVLFYQALNTFVVDRVVYEFNPVWSPDGEQIAFICYKPPLWEVVALMLGGEERLRHTDPYSSESSEICVMNADGSGRRQLTHNRVFDFDPAWSPDGTQIAFASDGERLEGPGRGYGLYVVNVDGSHERWLARIGADGVWSPKGDKIALINHSLYLVDVHSGVEEQLTQLGRWPKWSPDGEYIAYQEGEGRCSLHIIKLATRTTQTVPSIASACYMPSAWSPDGSRLAFIAQPQLGSHETRLMVYDLRSDSTLALTDATRVIVTGPVWGHEGDTLYFLSKDIYAVQADGSALRQVTHFQGGPMTFMWASRNPTANTLALSPTGTELAFALGEGASYNPRTIKIFKVMYDGTNPVQLSP